MTWCPTCGGSTPDGAECDGCAEWWLLNPPLEMEERQFCPEPPAARDTPAETTLRWYADQLCEGWCLGHDPRACAAIGKDNCAGCPAVVALAGLVAECGSG